MYVFFEEWFTPFNVGSERLLYKVESLWPNSTVLDLFYSAELKKNNKSY